ncbi:MAG: hypothetical protein LQ342_002139 [Letrouitia transgressa]|nr:MAG: hypothetical protein LQ342_002139 [Letrouitia transgressa]
MIRAISPEVPVKTTAVKSESESESSSYLSPRSVSPHSDSHHGSHPLTNGVALQPNQRAERHDSSTSTIRPSRSKPRTRTLEEHGRKKSPSDSTSKMRRRSESLQSASLYPNDDDEDAPSIGFPSTIPSSPPKSESQGSRRRLVKPQSRPLTPPKGPIPKESKTSQSSSATDVKKVLQLMKTTCGRMQGILSFRSSSSNHWSSGYCAINVATGSLIYQAKGDVSQTKTLVPDLRGCHVRTLYDGETKSTFLDVSTHSSTVGIHLRPHVPETFDGWLAALLCWQPIRPKGVYNKMTKRLASPATERRQASSRRTSEYSDRRRNSEIIHNKEAAIIKVGKMLLWDKDVRTATATISSRRISTYKQQRSLSTSWRKVSCTLQENGHFKLYTDSDVSLVSLIPLCQLSRCAIQRLHPSILDDEFCLAIYPQYSSTTDGLPYIFPVYLSLESRVLFEVWFVLLRAFTIPQLYGPEQITADPQLVPVEAATAVSRASSPSADVFRVEKLLSLRIVEAKLYSSRKRHSRRSGSKPAHSESSKRVMIPGNYFAEVRLDGEIRGKTAVKPDNANPFWREDFEFIDLPPVLSSASIEVKTRNPGQRDWTLIANGPLDLELAQLDPLAIDGDIEISPLESIYGRVELQFDENDKIRETEKWWPVVNEFHEEVGEVLMRVHIEELVVLMGRDYQPLSELLHNFSNALTSQIAALFPPGELRKLSELLLNIFQVSAQADEWLLSLVEDEIDNIHKEPQHTRYRYGRRIASNDSFESGIEREMLLRDLGKSAVIEANLLFRGNTLLTKALDLHMQRLGRDYLEETLGERIREIDTINPECEVDPNRVQELEVLNNNRRSLIAYTEAIWKAISESTARCPPELRRIFRHISACADDRYGDFLRTITYSSVSGFLFLRFFCPAILNPKLFGLLKDHPRPQAQRTLTLISKTLNALGNLSTFGNKEPWMEPMNSFLNTHRQGFKDFVDTICAISPDHANSAIPPSYATPITILGRLPGTSREGFPSLPYLIDQAKECAALVELWLDGTHSNNNTEPMSDELKLFNDLCISSREKTKHCLSRAEQAERPSGVLEPKWEELVEQMGRKARIRIANGQKSSEPTWPGAAEATRRKARIRIQNGNNSSGTLGKENGSRTGTENSSTTSLVSSYFHRNPTSHSSSRYDLSTASTGVSRGTSVHGPDDMSGASNDTQDGQSADDDEDDDNDSVEAKIDTPPEPSSAGWDLGVNSPLPQRLQGPELSGVDFPPPSPGAIDDEPVGTSIYRIGTPSSSSTTKRHHHHHRHHQHPQGQPRSTPKPIKTSASGVAGHHRRSAYSRDATAAPGASAPPELSSTSRGSPLSSRDGLDPPPEGKSIYRLKTPNSAERHQHQMELAAERSAAVAATAPRSPGSRDGGKFSFGDFGSVFRKRAKEKERQDRERFFGHGM